MVISLTAMMALQSLVGTIGAAVGVTDSQMSGQTNQVGVWLPSARLPRALLAQRVEILRQCSRC